MWLLATVMNSTVLKNSERSFCFIFKQGYNHLPGLSGANKRINVKEFYSHKGDSNVN